MIFQHSYFAIANATLATSVDVERTFSQGRLLLSHIRNRLSAQSTRATLCLGDWSKMGFMKNNDVMKVVNAPDVEGDGDSDGNVEQEEWDKIDLDSV